jgi:hypothetical protein
MYIAAMATVVLSAARTSGTLTNVSFICVILYIELGRLSTSDLALCL